MNKTLIVISLFLSVLLFSCSKGVDSPTGFSLPRGDIAKGKAALKKYQCLACHTLEGFEDYAVPNKLNTPIKLGGTSVKVKTYAQLVTSIINPSHKIVQQSYALSDVTNDDGSSKMQNYNELMTVSELADIVMFLQVQYKVQPIQYKPH